MAEAYRQEVVFIGVSNRDTVDAGKRYRDELGVPYALAHAPDVWDLYDTTYQPVTVVIGADGAVATRFDGPVTGEALADVLEAELRKA